MSEGISTPFFKVPIVGDTVDTSAPARDRSRCGLGAEAHPTDLARDPELGSFECVYCP